MTVLCPSYPSCKGEQNSAHKRRETIEGGWSNSILSFSSRTLESCLRVRATAPGRDFCQFGEKIKSNLPFSHLEVQDDPAKKSRECNDGIFKRAIQKETCRWCKNQPATTHMSLGVRTFKQVNEKRPTRKVRPTKRFTCQRNFANPV